MDTLHNNLIHQTIRFVTAVACATAAPIPPPLIAAPDRGLQVMSTLYGICDLSLTHEVDWYGACCL